MKYIVVGYTKEIDLKKGAAKILVLSETANGSLCWRRPEQKGVRCIAFNAKDEAEVFIAEHKIVGAIPYSVVRGN